MTFPVVFSLQAIMFLQPVRNAKPALRNSENAKHVFITRPSTVKSLWPKNQTYTVRGKKSLGLGILEKISSSHSHHFLNLSAKFASGFWATLWRKYIGTAK